MFTSGLLRALLLVFCIGLFVHGGAVPYRERSRSPVETRSSAATSSKNDLPVNRQQAARVFANAGKKAGLEIWRIEVSVLHTKKARRKIWANNLMRKTILFF